MVPLARLERALLAELDFESSASTNSATGARGSYLGEAPRRGNRSRGPSGSPAVSQAKTSATPGPFGSSPKRFAPLVPSWNRKTSRVTQPINDATATIAPGIIQVEAA